MKRSLNTRRVCAEIRMCTFEDHYSGLALIVNRRVDKYCKNMLIYTKVLIKKRILNIVLKGIVWESF